MALPHQVRLSISYDGTVMEAATVTGSSSNTGNASIRGTYTVQSGDTLWRIAKQHYGSGMRYTEIYNANAEQIESVAKAHGKASSSGGHWIWPGEVLVIPGVSGESASAAAANKKNGTSKPWLGKKIASSATGFKYMDVASGQSDSVSITMHDIDKEWMGGNMPCRGAGLGAKVITTNWNSDTEGDKIFDCGSFIIDDISFSGRPLSCVLGGVSVPAMDDFKSKQQTKTWEKTTVKGIASDIASAAGVSLYYDGPDYQVAEIEQSRETNSAFLYSLCEKYGLAMKVYNHKIVIFDFVVYEEKEPVATINENDMVSWNANTTIEGTYTGVSLNYTDPDTENSINVVVGSEGKMYSINAQAYSQYDAELQAAAKVNQANRSIETMEVTIRANTKIVASQNVKISGLGNLSGKYFIDKIKHSIGSSGYKMQLTLHKVQPAIKVNAPVPQASGAQAYTVVSGDTLWGISKKFYGTGTKYNIIYDANADLIEITAKEHGKSNSSNGHWIWPGETLTIPEV